MSTSPTEDDYAAVLKHSRPLIDVRAPAEFARGALPGAVSLPILDDAERAAVGETYKRSGRDAALALGLKLVDGENKRSRIAAWRDFAAEHPGAAIYCWRGGMRSQIAQRWLAEGGVALPRIVGGFKALRGFCLQVHERSGERQFLLVGGRTGSGKTAVVRAVANHVDLEALANHRGSAFGGHPTPQPPPVAFENALAVALLKTDDHAPTAIEDEGRSIGRLAIPQAVYDAMQRAPIVVLEVPRTARVDNIYQEYVVQAERPRERLLAALARIQRRLGGTRYQEVAALMTAAFDQASAELHRQWIDRLLAWYYDPMYDYQLGRKAERVVQRGAPEEMAAYLRSLDKGALRVQSTKEKNHAH